MDFGIWDLGLECLSSIPMDLGFGILGLERRSSIPILFGIWDLGLNPKSQLNSTLTLLSRKFQARTGSLRSRGAGRTYAPPAGRAPPARAHLRAATSPTCERCQANFFAQGASITLLLHAVPPLIDPVQSLKRFRTAYVYTSTYIALKYILHLVGLARWRNRSICCVRSPYR